MVLMRMKIENDKNIIKYISIIRKKSNLSIKEIKEKIENNDVVFECDYFDTDELKRLKKIIDELISEGAKVYLFLYERKLSLVYLDNIIISHE